MTDQPGRWRAILLIVLATLGVACSSARAQQDADRLLSEAVLDWKQATVVAQDRFFERIALLDTDAKRLLTVLVEACREPRPEVRAKAAFFIGRNHADPERSVPVLAALLKDEDDAVRVSAVGALCQYGRRGSGAIAALVEAAGAHASGAARERSVPWRRSASRRTRPSRDC